MPGCVIRRRSGRLVEEAGGMSSGKGLARVREGRMVRLVGRKGVCGRVIPLCNVSGSKIRRVGEDFGGRGEW